MTPRKQSSYWPPIETSEKAVELMRNGSFAAAFTAIMTAGISVAAMYLGHPIMGLDGFGLVDAFLFGVVTWRIYRLSLPWAISGFLIFTGEKVYGVVSNPQSGTAGIIVACILFFYYLNAVRGGLYLRREKSVLAPAASVE
jgi:hypothetical protein